ncbi:hypothetical protein F7734_17715 [Scytonema sp. UIC 10036]|uniref:hypothetical protein n=1 Tax=Scytonema sp. UIC 10036 TaxID=2304196 RepID=UPI0012DAE264|nr:hypothetical protein [Scytonema sp. UIC 10036]MUG94125.1 hypothetical protein [Scytonema sp. UIC 10036]
MKKVIFEQIVESVKSILSSKNFKSNFVGNLIKSKPYLFLLLTITTGGISIGNIMISGQILPAHARVSRVVEVVIQNIPQNFQLYPGQALRLICRGVGYGSPGDHTAYFYRRLSQNSWQDLGYRRIPFGRQITTGPFSAGTYYYKIVSQAEVTKKGYFTVR